MVPPLFPRPPVRHCITHRRILAHIYQTEIASPPPDLATANRFAWIPRAEADRCLTSSLFRKGLAAAKGKATLGEMIC